jgi:hypothetical protein
LVLNHQIPAYRIYVIGMGNASVAKGASRTRVEIRLLKNDLEQTAKQQKNGVFTSKARVRIRQCSSVELFPARFAMQ